MVAPREFDDQLGRLMGDRPTGRSDPFVLLGPFFGFAGDLFPSRVEFGLVFQADRVVIERRFDDSEFGLKIPFSVQIDQELPCRFGRIDEDVHRLAWLIDDLTTEVERLDSKGVRPIALGLELKLTLFGVGFGDALPGFSGILGDLKHQLSRWGPDGTEFEGDG